MSKRTSTQSFKEIKVIREASIKTPQKKTEKGELTLAHFRTEPQKWLLVEYL